jgi:hypothetical protein
MKLIDVWKMEGRPDAKSFLYERLSGKPGGISFVDAASEALSLEGSELIWWCGMIQNYHHHPDYTIDNLLRTMKHFKNMSRTFINDGKYSEFKVWINNWSDLMIVCNYLDPERWK